jgi:RecA-family ATPase
MTTFRIEENPLASKIGVADWLQREYVPPKPEEYLIEDLIPANSLVCLQTNGVYGKTTLALQLAMSVAFQVPFLGRYACLQPGKVLFINARDTDDDCHRRFKRLVREWSRSVPELATNIAENSSNFTHISLFDECYGVSPHLIDVSGSMTKTYAYLLQMSEYFKNRLIVLDPVEDFFPENLKNMSELYLKLRQIKSTVLLVVGERSRYDAFHEVEVSMSLMDTRLRIHSDYLGQRDIGVEMGAGIWVAN